VGGAHRGERGGERGFFRGELPGSVGGAGQGQQRSPGDEPATSGDGARRQRYLQGASGGESYQPGLG